MADICQLFWLITPEFGFSPSTSSNFNIFGIRGFQTTLLSVDYFCFIPIVKLSEGSSVSSHTDTVRSIAK
jgi:hypothetical protein